MYHRDYRTGRGYLLEATQAEVSSPSLPSNAQRRYAGKSDEVSEVGWFTPDALPNDFLPKHRQRLEDALTGQREAIVRAQRTSTEEDQGLSGNK